MERHNRGDVHAPMRLTYDFVPGGGRTPFLLRLFIILLRFRCCPYTPYIPYSTSRHVAQALNEFSLAVVTSPYPRYARKLPRNVVLGQKFAVAVIEPPYRAQLSTTEPRLLRYTFESDFSWMSDANVVAICGIRMCGPLMFRQTVGIRNTKLGNDTAVTRNNEAWQATRIIENIFHRVTDDTRVVNNII